MYRQSFGPEVFWHVWNILTSITYIWLLVIFNNWEHKQINRYVFTNNKIPSNIPNPFIWKVNKEGNAMKKNYFTT